MILTSQVMCHLNIYEEEAELIINGMHIRSNTYLELVRDIKNKIIDQLIDLSKRIIRYILTKHYGEETNLGGAAGVV